MKYSIIILCIILLIYYFYTKDKNTNKQFNTQDNFLSDKDCDKLIELIEHRLKPSTVVLPGKSAVDLDSRTSNTAFFKRSENKIVRKIENRVCKMLNVSPYQLEPLQVAKYIEGQQYKYHYDFFNSEINEVTNQRHHTVIIYLNNVKKKNGGCTDFKYGDSHQPIKGKMLHWSNLDNELNPDKSTLHAGKPIIGEAEKYIVTVWTRLNEY